VTVVEVLDQLEYKIEADGSVVFLHASGSSIRFDINGDVTIHATGTLRYTAERYTCLGNTSEEEMDEINLSRIANGDSAAIKDILEDKKLPHLYERALEVYESTRTL
jgi:uncharacterized protein (DUF2345 family)